MAFVDPRSKPHAYSGVRLYACKASVDMFGLEMEDFVPQVEEIISVGEFYEKAADR
jgi:peroxiredoxin family protein